VRCLVCGSFDHTKQRCAKAGKLGEVYVSNRNNAYQRSLQRQVLRSKV
jgi:hypothetical protein